MVFIFKHFFSLLGKFRYFSHVFTFFQIVPLWFARRVTSVILHFPNIPFTYFSLFSRFTSLAKKLMSYHHKNILIYFFPLISYSSSNILDTWFFKVSLTFKKSSEDKITKNKIKSSIWDLFPYFLVNMEFFFIIILEACGESDNLCEENKIRQSNGAVLHFQFELMSLKKGMESISSFLCYW